MSTFSRTKRPFAKVTQVSFATFLLIVTLFGFFVILFFLNENERLGKSKARAIIQKNEAGGLFHESNNLTSYPIDTSPGDIAREWKETNEPSLFNSRLKAIKIMEDAATCYFKIDDMIERLPEKEQNTIRQLDALQKIFFERDWVFASWVDPKLNGADAEKAFEIFKSSSGKIEWEKLMHQFLNDEEIETQLVHNLKKFYESRMGDRNPAYKNVALKLNSLFNSEIPLMSSDLLSDAWTYVGLRTEIRDNWSESIQWNQGLSDHMLNNDSLSMESRSKLRQSDEAYVETITQSAEIALETYDQLFSWRFKNIHGISDPEAVLEALSELEMRNVMGKDVRLPYPGE